MASRRLKLEYSARCFTGTLWPRLSQTVCSRLRLHRHLTLVVVDPTYQGKGVGRALIEWGTSHADASGPPMPCYLESSEAAIKVYEKLGFESVEELEMFESDAAGKKVEGSELTLPVMLRPAKKKVKLEDGV